MDAATSESRLPSPSDLRWFGAVVFVFFAILGTIAVWQFASPRFARAAWGVGAALGGLYYAAPPLRVPMYLAWMRLFRPIGSTVSVLLLGFVYFAVLTPIAWLMKIFRRDRLGRTFDAERESYWVKHDPSGDVDRYFRQT